MQKLLKVSKILTILLALVSHDSFASIDHNITITNSPEGTMSVNESATIKNGLNALAQFQSKLDVETWQISKPDMAKLRHISLHLTRISGSIADMCHKWEHDLFKDEQAISDMTNINPEVMQDIVADLIIHAVQLSNLIDRSPYSALSQRVARNIPRFAPDCKLSLDP